MDELQTLNDPADILNRTFAYVLEHLPIPIVTDGDVLARVEIICRNVQNRAGVRLVLACLLAKVHRPDVDVLKPYTQIDAPDTFSGRTYDERYITEFIIRHRLPCNLTTAFLTPALRNRNTVLTPDLELEGRPREVYKAALQLLTDVYENRVSANDLLSETIRQLLLVRDERQQRMESLLAGLNTTSDGILLSTEAIVTLIQQHLASRGSSRLPVLVVAAVYQSAESHLGERVLPLESHNAADSQTQALGDVQITLAADDHVITCYEMKARRVHINDLDQAAQKVASSKFRIDNFIFITTDVITPEVLAYAASLYERTAGVEFVVLDCISFLRHFLHLFHRIRMKFLDRYQALVLEEPDSAVSQPLKEAFLALRQAAESEE